MHLVCVKLNVCKVQVCTLPCSAFLYTLIMGMSGSINLLFMNLVTDNNVLPNDK